MSLTTPIKSGNVPLQGLACTYLNANGPWESMFPNAIHFFPPFMGFGWDMIVSMNMGPYNSSSWISLVLPVPGGTTSEQPKRCISIAWSLGLDKNSDPGATYTSVKYAVALKSIPSRVAGSDGRFLSGVGCGFIGLADEFEARHPLGDAKCDQPTVTTFNVKGLEQWGDNPGRAADAECRLFVALPCKATGTISSLVLRIHGIAVDQW